MVWCEQASNWRSRRRASGRCGWGRAWVLAGGTPRYVCGSAHATVICACQYLTSVSWCAWRRFDRRCVAASLPRSTTTLHWRSSRQAACSCRPSCPRLRRSRHERRPWRPRSSAGLGLVVAAQSGAPRAATAAAAAHAAHSRAFAEASQRPRSYVLGRGLRGPCLFVAVIVRGAARSMTRTAWLGCCADTET